MKEQNSQSQPEKLTKTKFTSKETKRQKPRSSDEQLDEEPHSSQRNSQFKIEIQNNQVSEEKPQSVDRNQEPHNRMDEEIKPTQMKHQQNQDLKPNILKVDVKEQMMNEDEKAMLQGYIEAIKYLQNPKNEPQIKSILQSQINYLRATQCSVCCQHFDAQNRKPMIVCSKSSSHVLCSTCLQKQTNINKQSRCYICRRPIKREDVKVDDDILAWIKVNKRLGVQTPTLYGLIPKQLYESLRKISYHNLAKIQTKRKIEQSQTVKYEMIRLKMINKKMQSQIKQKELDLKKIEQKLKVSIESFEAIKQQLEPLRMNAIYQSNSSLSWKEFLINLFKKMKEEMGIDFQFLATMDFKYEELIPQMVQHQKQKHQSERLYRFNQIEYVYYNGDRRSYCPYFNPSPSQQCLECKIFVKQAQKKIKNLENLRIASLQKYYQFLKKYGHIILFIFQQFVPKTVEQFKQDRKKYFHLIGKQQISILEEIHSQNFEKMDINHFWKILKTEQKNSSLQTKNAQMENDKKIEKTN